MTRVNFVPRRFARRTAVAVVMLSATLLSILGCAGQPEIREVEVIREVPVTQEVPVTVETVQTVEVTREVPVAQEVPVTVAVPQTVEVTRTVETIRTVEVTREVPVTNVAPATPAPTAAPTAEKPATPTPNPTPFTAPTPAATPETETPTVIGSWQMERTEYGGNRDLMSFYNTAVEHHPGTEAPTLIYRCIERGSFSMYINWRYPLVTVASNVSRRYGDDSFGRYYDYNLDALIDYAASLSEFAGDLHLSQHDRVRLDDLWTTVLERWRIDHQTPEGLFGSMRDRSLGAVEIELSFFVEAPETNRRSRYGPPTLASVNSYWLETSDHLTQIGIGPLGEVRPAYRELYSSAKLANQSQMMTATVKAQDATVIAKWEISGFNSVMSLCRP